MTVSRSERVTPAARTAPNDEPYSTSRCSSRFHQTRCGMWCTSGCAPVAIDARQTGVSDGNVEAARAVLAVLGEEAERRRVGGLEHRRRQAVDRRPGRPASASPAGSVAGERAQARVPLRRAGAQARAEHRHRERLEVADHRHERERGADERREREERRGAAARAAAPQRAARRAAPTRARRRARRPPPPAASSHWPKASPIATATATATTSAGERAPQRTGRGDAERRAEADEDADRVPVPHAARLHMGPAIGRA